LTPRLHVLLKKEDLEPTPLSEQVVIVLDILFATSSILVIRRVPT
jgi:2-phosphosulfolactate phosphatase